MTRTLYLVVAPIVILALLLFMIGCSHGTVTASIDAAIVAAQIALPLLATAGVSPAILNAAGTWLSGATQALDGVVAEIDSQDSAAVQSAKIAQLLSAYTAPKLPPGTPQAIVSAIEAVAQKIVVLLENTHQAKSLAAVRSPKPLKLTAADRKAIQKAHAQLVEIRRQLEKYKQ